ncbi:hypothetical protein [Streptomyces sp. S.PNR 29]|uniref:hypothetical protein n=1 Tax=Streptomyces sp. S.PNR 29 TaxID=2973805 RepID=UPI0025B1D4C9|nr:hypothetical protein [Streptomyces sp. S.PNR 29]MDN0198476.1 hypothetical protein [Streptomyces sp. S.PNR 29]
MPSERRTTEEKDRQVVVSVRFPSQLLDRIQAIAAVQSTTANAVIREGMDAYVRERVASAEFRAASEAYIARAQAQVATALQEHTPGSPGRP